MVSVQIKTTVILATMFFCLNLEAQTYTNTTVYGPNGQSVTTSLPVPVDPTQLGGMPSTSSQTSNPAANTTSQIGSASAGANCPQDVQNLQQSCRGNSLAGQAAASLQSAAGSSVNPNDPNAAAQAACNAEMIQGGTSLASVAMVLAPCKSAATQCQQDCTAPNANAMAICQQAGQCSGPQCVPLQQQCTALIQQYQSSSANCSSTFHSVEASAALAAGVSVMAFTQALNCDTGTTDTAPPALAALPTDPITDPNSPGFNGYPTTATAPATADTAGAGDSGAPLSSGAYPGGSGPNSSPANQAANGGLNTGVDHGVSGNNSGGGWPSGTGGAGWPTAGNGEKGLDLSQFLPGGKEDPKRGPASEKEITGANDLTNFQKITLMMNKKRTVLKVGRWCVTYKAMLTNLIVIFLLTFFINYAVNAQVGAAAAAASSGDAAGGAASVSAATGSTTMSKTCGTPWGAAICIAGAGLIVEAVMDAMQSKGYNSTGDALSTGSTDAGPGAGGGSGNTGASGALPPDIQAALNTGNAIAAQQGTTLQAMAAQAASGGGGDGGPGGLNMDNVPADVQAAIKKAAKDAASKYHISSVATEDVSGSGRAGRANSDGLDINALLNGLKDRAPASVAGLQKTLNGEAIGVAGDNIFQQITRKYKTKIASQTFLTAPTTLQKTLPHN